ncbi:MAG TPA: hypothetical protein PLP25_02975 [Candidatus Limiplasma sp.]|nr:hypothetical protein [Candidatus Limiplasma sp.]HPS80811.1 hypothetical protein [Candidatus Limiplasma sp.]
MKQVNMNRLDSALRLLELIPVRTMEEISLKVTAMQTIATAITDEKTPEAGKDEPHEDTAE